MGAGDWIMATSQVKAINAATRRKVLVVGRGGQIQWSEIFENNPRILRRYEGGCVRLTNGSGLRPYIESKTPTHWVWKRWPIAPGEIFLSVEEKAFAAPHRGRILVEPHTKVEGSNKAWFFDRWQALVDQGGEFVQVGPAGTRVLRGVHFVETTSFRRACAVLAVSRAFVGCEGGLHHAAAALGVPAVVLFSEFISPEITGYAGHRNLRHAGEACGSRLPCEGCRASMEAITVDEVHSNLKEFT
jgi:ADP-heptose:LPS heptosyltransferase